VSRSLRWRNLSFGGVEKLILRRGELTVATVEKDESGRWYYVGRLGRTCRVDSRLLTPPQLFEADDVEAAKGAVRSWVVAQEAKLEETRSCG